MEMSRLSQTKAKGIGTRVKRTQDPPTGERADKENNRPTAILGNEGIARCHPSSRVGNTTMVLNDILIWAFEFLQSLRKISPGTPDDTQLGVYLPDCDYLVTADKVLSDVVKKYRLYAPVQVGNVIRVPAGDKVIDEMFKILDSEVYSA